MKIQKKLIFSLTIVMSVFLIGCNKSVQTESITNTEVPASSENTTVSAQTSQSQSQEGAIQTYSAADQQIINDALAMNDKTVCEKSSTKEIVDACKKSIDANNAAQAEKEKSLAQIKEQNEKMNAYVYNGDYMKCLTLEDSNLARSCELNILSNKAIQQNDQRICQKGTSKDVQNECQNIYEQNKP